VGLVLTFSTVVDWSLGQQFQMEQVRRCLKPSGVSSRNYRLPRRNADWFKLVLSIFADVEDKWTDPPASYPSFRSIPLQTLGIPSLIVASSNDPYLSLSRGNGYSR
jgi:hypothetical protein